MNTKPLLLALVLCFPLTARAAEWAPADTHRELAFDALLALDTLQTHSIAHVPTYQEVNPLLGAHPSNAAVNRYMLGCALGHYLISRALPAEDRRYWQWLTLGVEGGIVAHNIYIGVHAPF
jgi:hypothetical protein